MQLLTGVAKRVHLLFGYFVFFPANSLPLFDVPVLFPADPAVLSAMSLKKKSTTEIFIIAS